METKSTFSRIGFINGLRQTLPIALSVFVYVAVFGMLARQVGMSLVEALLMSGFVFAGGSQLVVLTMWHAPLPILSIVITTLIVNLRHILMGASLRPFLTDLSKKRVYGLAFFMVDESWALTTREFNEGRTDATFLLGSGITLLVNGQLSTAFGYVFGSVLQNPERWGLDFAFTAVFTALVVSMWKEKSNLLPWAVAAVVALITEITLPGKWYILLGGLVGSFTGAFGDED